LNGGWLYGIHGGFRRTSRGTDGGRWFFLFEHKERDAGPRLGFELFRPWSALTIGKSQSVAVELIDAKSLSPLAAFIRVREFGYREALWLLRSIKDAHPSKAGTDRAAGSRFMVADHAYTKRTCRGEESIFGERLAVIDLADDAPIAVDSFFLAGRLITLEDD
jgi:hypothetical protein